MYQEFYFLCFFNKVLFLVSFFYCKIILPCLSLCFCKRVQSIATVASDCHMVAVQAHLQPSRWLHWDHGALWAMHRLYMMKTELFAARRFATWSRTGFLFMAADGAQLRPALIFFLNISISFQFSVPRRGIKNVVKPWMLAHPTPLLMHTCTTHQTCLEGDDFPVISLPHPHHLGFQLRTKKIDSLKKKRGAIPLIPQSVFFRCVYLHKYS